VYITGLLKNRVMVRLQVFARSVVNRGFLEPSAGLGREVESRQPNQIAYILYNGPLFEKINVSLSYSRMHFPSLAALF